MAATPVRLFSTQLSTTSETTLFTAGGGQTVIVKQVVIANTSGSAVTVRLSLVPSGGSSGATNRLLGGTSLAANDSLVLDLSQVLAAGDFLAASAATANVVTLTGSGVRY